MNHHLQLASQPCLERVDFSDLECRLVEFVSKFPTAEVMPSFRELKEAGKTDLILLVGRFGGRAAVAARLGVRRADALTAAD